MSITARVSIIVVALAALLALALGAWLLSVERFKEAGRDSRASDEILNKGYLSLQAVADMDTGVRTYLLVGNRRALAPWHAGRRDFARSSALLQRAVNDPVTRSIAQRITQAGDAYIEQYAAPLVARRARGPLTGAGLVTATTTGQRRVASIRRMFDELIAVESRDVRAHTADTRAAARSARNIGLAAIAASLILLLVFGGLLRRDVLRPLRSLGKAADDLAAGDLRARVGAPRLPEFQPLHQAFNAMASDLATARAEQLAANSTLERRVAERTGELEAARLELLVRLARATEYRDDDTRQHTERVGRTSALIADALGLPEEQAKLLRLAAPLHDIGKIGTPDAILLKPGALTTSERAEMQRHTIVGADLLADSDSDVLQMAEQIALGHHERWDGTGYPHARRRTDIPLVARIVAVADVFDALTHERPYKEAWPVDRALGVILDEAGAQFDPEVVRAFATLDHEALLSSTAVADAGARNRHPAGSAAF